MFFDIGWPELMLIGVVALVVIGPKDLPRALRIAGYWVRKARTLSREFQSSVEQMIREAELDEMRQELKKATEFNLEKEFNNTIDADGSLAESIKPPAIPDYFDETATPAAAATASAEAGAVEEQPELPLPPPAPAPAAEAPPPETGAASAEVAAGQSPPEPEPAPEPAGSKP